MKQQGYLSYLLRLWETSDGDKAVWRASVERPGTGERQSFADVQTLFEFLQREMRESGAGSKEYGVGGRVRNS
ncbi:MAG TPA: hypothetical protein PLJ78_17070 [Anaerolineae bacterium]|nr:hypothetical protein [Anaerolineae bacterium]HQK15644.1 hypothetical protein [Anaerolineae bacterium]